jgi:prepilin-type N-terminal cleavage/methylation domain-containing protein
MMSKKLRQSGFTLLEILLVIAIIAVIAAIAVPLYRDYIVRAHVADLVSDYEAIRDSLALSYDREGTCADTVNTIEPGFLQNPHVALDIGMETIGSRNGFTPNLRICAEVVRHGKLGIQVATAAHKTFAKLNQLAPGAVVGTTLVSFAVRLAPAETSVCTQMTYTTTAATGCGGAGGLVPFLAPTMPAPQAVKAPPKPGAPPAPTPMQVKVPKLQAYVMKFSGTDTYVRPAGETLKTNGPLDAFTMEMSFIGDPNIAAASGGQGPVMFNYGDSSNAHNAISLWNPKSLTIALLNQNYDSGINVADGQTHRITTSWDSATGRLAIFDNGAMVKSWDNVHTGQSIPGDGRMVIAHKSTGGGAYNPGEAFTGQIFNTAFARGAVADGDLSKPLNQVVDPGSGLLADFQVVGGRAVDATGRHTVETGGMTPTMTGVEGNLIKQP